MFHLNYSLSLSFTDKIQLTESTNFLLTQSTLVQYFQMMIKQHEDIKQTIDNIFIKHRIYAQISFLNDLNDK